MSFSGKVALITGAAGTIGSGAVRAFLDRGAKVIAVSRSQSSLDKLAQTLRDYNTPTDNLIPYVADVGKDEDLGRLAAEIKAEKYPVPDHVVSCSGPWWHLPELQEISVEKFREVMVSNFESHFFIYRNFAPFVLDKSGATYTLVTGGIGEGGTASLVSLTQNAQYGLAKVAIHETRAKAVRFNELRISFRIETDANWDKMVKAGQVHEGEAKHAASREFGPVFTAIASAEAADQKGNVIYVNSRAKAAELEEKYL
ncbi:hypothetical protein BC938DRAFT_478686 [Jimgerdemannia flammicorona]|uniref:NAD(P)-binding protein n=1 Tax=Jimgerdemannia flammicorona TaxID=994334 RepID=A0A433QYF9_9FUNG|nr:hypothetical protein BC938DRAFT_478686 [Jimgerdemannia flammicorona]